MKQILRLVPFQNLIFLFFDIDLLFPRIRALQATFKAVLIAVYMTYTVSQERFQPMMSPTRDFILEMILRQPYIEMLSSPQNIFVPLFEILTTLLGEIY